jgi:hypothetical protein
MNTTWRNRLAAALEATASTLKRWADAMRTGGAGEER